MATFSKAELSGSTDGRGILVAATVTPGTLIHTAGAVLGDDNYDEVYLWAVNSDTVDRKLTIEFGGTTAPNDLIELTIPAESGLMLVTPGLILQNALVVRAFAATANLVIVHGYVNKIRV
ncbi:MAG: hypothetical protein ACRD5H_01085 [Nitrososphaerales archaeon]